MLPEEGTLEWELMQARRHAAQALTLVYAQDPPILGMWWRLRLLKAESLLMRLLLKEVDKREGN
jgi:hypothetical protein